MCHAPLKLLTFSPEGVVTMIFFDSKMKRYRNPYYKWKKSSNLHPISCGKVVHIRFVENVEANFVEFIQLSKYNGIHNKITVEPVTIFGGQMPWDTCRGSVPLPCFF